MDYSTHNNPGLASESHAGHKTSDMHGSHERHAAPSFPGSKFIPAILGTVVFVYGGLVFIRGQGGNLPITSLA